MDYKKGVEEAFASSSTKAKVDDIYVVPDYSSWIGAFVDPSLGLLHKELYTKLQWIFEYTEPSIYFPLGVKTIYRDFSSSRVCIIREVPKDSASTTLGQKTGLEPYALPVINHPTPNAFHDRPVEGFSLLVDLPCISKSRWQPSKFDSQTAEKFESVRNGVFEFYAIENPKRSEWDTWFELHCPFTSDVHEYLKSHIMLRPLESVFNLNVKIEQYWLQHATIPQFSVGSELSEQDWIDMAPAMTQDSVACRFNIHPPPPILFFANGGDHVTSFLENVVRYYDKVLSISTNAYLVYLLKRKIDAFGGAVKVSGKSKLQLEGLVKEHNRDRKSVV